MESLSRISGMLETARDLTLEAARDASSLRRPSNRATPAAQLKKLLDSRNDRDVLEGLRRVISMTYRGQHTLPFFSAVIKNIASPNIEVKKLVYIYLVHHAEAEPDTALLSINTIQKSLTDANPQVRALALRVMSGIKVPVISQIVSLGIKRGVGDMSPYVRKAAALAIPKCYRLDPTALPQLLEFLTTLLGDKQYYVVGAAVPAFLEICPDRLDLIHPHYRSLVRKLVDMDEWGQLATLRLMLVYARKCFPRRTRKVRNPALGSTAKSTKGFYDESSDSEPEDQSQFVDEPVLDPDLELLLNATKPLLQSRNSAVILAVARCYLYLGTPAHLATAIGPLIALLRTPTSMQQIALHNIVQICLLQPDLFIPYYRHFFIRSTDAAQIWALKLELLTLIFPNAPKRLQSLILAELSHFSRSSSSYDTSLVREAVRAIGRCAQRSQDPATSARCLKLLLAHIGTADAHLVAESLEVIRHMIQRNPEAHRGTIIRLAKHLDVATSPQARASIIWLVGEFAVTNGSSKESIAPDVLRILVRGFADEQELAKIQIVLLAAKLYLHHLNETQTAKSGVEQNLMSENADGTNSEHQDLGFTEHFIADPNSNNLDTETESKEHPIVLLWRHVLLLTRYDTSYSLRDRSRVFRSLLSVPSSTALASLLLLAPKPVPQIPNPSSARKKFTLGSASLVIGEEGGVSGLRGYEELPDWVKAGQEPDARLRDESASGNPEYGDSTTSASDKLAQVASVAGKPPRPTKEPNGVGEKSLDDWFAEEEKDEIDEDEETDEETETSESESEYESEEETDEEVDDDDETDEGEADRLVK